MKSLTSSRFLIALFALVAALALAPILHAQSLTTSPGNHLVRGNLDVTGTARLNGDATVGDDLTVTDAVTAADVTASDDLTATDDLAVGDDATVTGDLDVSGLSRLARWYTTTITTNALAVTSGYYGQWILVNTNAAVTITMPTNGAPAGVWFGVAVKSTATDDCAPTIAAASADTLIGPNDVDLDSVTWGTGHRIGAQAKFWSDGSFWRVQNLGGTTMTYTD